MKKYCINCGYANEYSGATPTKCAKCKMDFTLASQKIARAVKQSSSIEEIEGVDNFEDSEFGTYMDFEPERISQNEIEALFLSKGSQPISLKNLIEDVKKNAPLEEVPKKRGRPVKKK